MDDVELNENKVIMIGNCIKFDNTKLLYYCKKLRHGSFKGIGVHHIKTLKNKEDAIAFAKKVHSQNAPFADGTIPFEIIFYVPRVGYEIASSNLLSNERHFKICHS